MQLSLLLTAMALVVVSCGGSTDQTELIDGLVAHYELNGDGADALGTSPGALIGGAPAEDRGGVDTAALQFAAGDYIEIPHTGALGITADFTIAAWIRPANGAAPGSFATIFEKSDPERGGHSRYGLWLRDGHLWTCFEAADNSRQPCVDTDVTLTLGAWHHVAAVRSAMRAILYVDGEEVANAFVGLYEVSSTPFSAFIGTDRYQQPAEWLHATLDDVRIYNRALEMSEIGSLAAG